MTPTALNDQGDVVGTMQQANGSAVPFLYTGGTVTI
jgi:probable HAF family extracellular repeat protein